MKQLKDYKNTKTIISFESKDEYDKMVPLLNKVFKGWLNSSEILYLTDYINMNNDCLSESKIIGYEIIPASEFLIKTNYNYYY